MTSATVAKTAKTGVQAQAKPDKIRRDHKVNWWLTAVVTVLIAVPYRENKIKPLFIKMKNQIAALAGKVVELNKMVESWKISIKNLLRNVIISRNS